MSTSGNRASTGTERDRTDHWPEIARLWRHIGPPLRPVAQDVRFYSDAVREWVGLRGAPRALLLGVTPELYRLPWPEGTDLLAVDRSQDMIDRVWPGPKDAARCMSWLDLSLPGSSRDIVLCDGGLQLLAHPQGQRRLAHVLRGILSDGGLCVVRLYAPPARRESPDAVLRDLLEGKIACMNLLKLRLGMSLMNAAAEGVELGTIWRALHAAAPDLNELAARIGWSAEHMSAIDPYRDSAVRYHFVTADQVSQMFCGDPGGFEVRRVSVPDYELGERCPTIVLQRRPRASTD